MDFSNDSRLGRALEKLLDICKMNLLWLLCCLPVVTAGASTAALFYTMNRYRRGEGTITADFREGIKSNFRQGTVIWLLLILAAGGIAGSAMILQGFPDMVRKLGLGLLAMISVLLWMFASMVFPLMARYRIKLAVLASDSLLTAIAFFPKTLKIMAIGVLPLVLLVLLPRGLLLVLLLWCVMGVGWQCYRICGIMDRIFETLEQRKDD